MSTPPKINERPDEDSPEFEAWLRQRAKERSKRDAERELARKPSAEVIDDGGMTIYNPDWRDNSAPD